MMFGIIESYADREDEGILLVRKAGEMLYRHESDQTLISRRKGAKTAKTRKVEES